jgi:ribosomal protein S18 acetylase RimI-like enzyme
VLDIEIRPAQPLDLAGLSRLFDLYRQFYRQAPDLALARDYLQQRLTRADSTLLVALHADQVIAFTQLYWTLCSVSAAPIAILYDLYVDVPLRQRGVGRALMQAARYRAAADGAVRMELATATTNVTAQGLYESLGWVRDEVFLRYSLALP